MFSTKHLLFGRAPSVLVRGGAVKGFCVLSSATSPAVASAIALRYSPSLIFGEGSTALKQQQRCFSSSVADGRSSASQVIVDPKKAASERDRMAREMLSSNLPRRSVELSLVMIKGLEYTVPYTLNVVVEDATDAKEAEVREKAQAILADGFDIVNRYLNNYNPESEVSQLNRMSPRHIHKMSPHLKTVMECCVNVNRVSGTCFDPATWPLTQRLRGAMQNRSTTVHDMILQEGDLEKFSLHNSFDINLENGTIARKHDQAMIDLGGVSKGYTVDYVIEKLNESGLVNVMFEWGGDCRAKGLNAQRQQWAVAISRPPTVEEIVARAKSECSISDVGSADACEKSDEENEAAATREIKKEETSTNPDDAPLLRVMHLDDEAICTSGDYENILYHPRIGVRSNIFDWKKAGMLEPVDEELAQVSVRCYSAMYADALATAALVKRDTIKVRYMLENYRWNRNRVTDYSAYTRHGERLAHMYEISCESEELREERIAGSLPARVVIVGGGLAGLSAAIEAANCGAQVILMEKTSKLGGNSAKATSGINGWGTRAQALNDVQDNCKFFERDTFLSGVGGQCNPGLVRTLSVKSGEAIGWLSALGIPLSVLSQLGGHSRKRTHRAPDTADGTPVPIGFTIMRQLEEFIRQKMSSNITIMTKVSVTSLLHSKKSAPDGSLNVRVTGVTYVQTDDAKAETMYLPADAVILATGGFSNDHSPDSLMREFAPQIYGTPTTNGTFATGDGVKLARRLGATLVDMDKVQLHPTGLIDPKDPANGTKYLGPEALRGSGGILINKNGERFVNELDLRSVVSAAINAQREEYPNSGGSFFAHCVLNEAAAKLFGVNSLAFYRDTLGLFKRVEDIEELAKLIGCDLTQLRDTLTAYEETSSAKSVCLQTGKIVFPCVIGPQGPFYVAFVTPSIHYTMGGCLISPSGELLQERRDMHLLDSLRPIQALFGAGEVTGGVHGRNRLGGNSLLECVVFGRIAGDRAATILKKKKNALSKDSWTPVTIREVRCGEAFGSGSRVLRFNLPGALQRSGLGLGQYLAIRGEWDGEHLIGYYSPITLPDERGTISILVRGDKGTLKEWINAMRPGDSVEMRACGGLLIHRVPEKKQLLIGRHVVRRLGLIAGGSGVAPMLQIIRAALERPYVDTIESIRLIYAAEEYDEVTYREVLRDYAKENMDKFSCEFVLNNPPEGWTGGVGFIDRSVLRRGLQPPSNDMLVAICGPPAMQRAVKVDLLRMGYKKALVHTIDEDME